MPVVKPPKTPPHCQGGKQTLPPCHHHIPTADSPGSPAVTLVPDSTADHPGSWEEGGEKEGGGEEG